MHIVRRIRVQVMMAMFGSPPKHAFLRAALGQEGKDELEYPARRISPMREVPMISGSDRKHAQPVQSDANCSGLPRDARPDRRDASRVDQYERQDLRIHDVVVFVMGFVKVFLAGIGIDRHARDLSCFDGRTSPQPM
jgi:hypothetical protein